MIPPRGGPGGERWAAHRATSCAIVRLHSGRRQGGEVMRQVRWRRKQRVRWPGTHRHGVALLRPILRRRRLKRHPTDLVKVLVTALSHATAARLFRRILRWSLGAGRSRRSGWVPPCDDIGRTGVGDTSLRLAALRLLRGRDGSGDLTPFAIMVALDAPLLVARL